MKPITVEEYDKKCKEISKRAKACTTKEELEMIKQDMNDLEQLIKT